MVELTIKIIGLFLNPKQFSKYIEKHTQLNRTQGEKIIELVILHPEINFLYS